MSSDPTAAYTLREAKALHELGVRNHGWYMTEAEHRGVLEVLNRLEAENERLKLGFSRFTYARRTR